MGGGTQREKRPNINYIVRKNIHTHLHEMIYSDTCTQQRIQMRSPIHTERERRKRKERDVYI